MQKADFLKLMTEVLTHELMDGEMDLEQIKARFAEADVDNSGFLSAEELFNIISKFGAKVTMDQLKEMLSDLDMDSESSMDLAQFTIFLTQG